MVAREQSETWTGGARKRLPWLRLLLLAVGVFLLAYGIGFAFFLSNLPIPYEGAAKADAIVALTGQGGRLAPAVSLLEKGDGQRLLITGVNRLTSKRDLKVVLHGGEASDRRPVQRHESEPQAARIDPCGWGPVLKRKPVGPRLRLRL